MNNHTKYKNKFCTPAKGSFFAKSAKKKLLADLSEEMANLFKKKFRLLRKASHEYILKQNEPQFFSPWEWHQIAQYQALFKKNVAFITSDLSDVALHSFLQCEEKCGLTNQSFRKWEFTHSERHFLNDVRHYCHMVLNEKPNFKDMNFGPGSCSQLKGLDANLVRKLTELPHCTAHSHDLVIFNILKYMPLYAISSGLVTREKYSVSLAHRRLPTVLGNRFSSVPKNSKTDRPICIEPLGNMLLQKALGSQIRCLYNRFTGYDLNYVPDFHHELVKRSSIDGCYATIDLSNASDTISLELVRYILPYEWFDILNQVRSKKTQLPDGSWIFCEKFSSMGNGFTFELETVIFYAFLQAYKTRFGKRDDVISCFGDDMICPSSYDITPYLEKFGFTVNHEKTFFEGPFRESCGMDYHSGVLVRPIYLRNDQDSEVENLYRFLHVAKSLEEVFLFKFPASFWKRVISLIPKELRAFGHLDNQIPYGRSNDFFRYNHQKQEALGLQRVATHRVLPLGCDAELSCALAGIGPTGLTPRGGRYRLALRWRGGINFIPTILNE